MSFYSDTTFLSIADKRRQLNLMKNYRLKAKAKLKAQVNVARLMQPLDSAVASVPEIRALAALAPDSPVDTPQKIEAKVTSRKRHRDDPVVPEYEMRCQVPTAKGAKDYAWRGRCEDSSRFAVAFVEGSEVKISLVDHWFKFSRVIETVAQTEGDEKQERRLLTKDERIAEAFGKEQPAKRPRKSKKEESEEEADEEADFVEKFEDDEELAGEEEEEPTTQAPSVVPKKGLSESGKRLEKVLNPKEDAELSSSSFSSDGLDDSSDDAARPVKTALTKETFVREMIRLGKVSKRKLEESLQLKFDLRAESEQKCLAGFVKNCMDELREGAEVFYVLKEEYKRSMPPHAARVQFQTGRK